MTKDQNQASAMTDERVLFENAMGSIVSLTRATFCGDPTDDYADLEANAAWLAWNARAALATPAQQTESWLSYVDCECTEEQDKKLHTVSGFRAGQAYNALCNMIAGRFPDSRIENEAPIAHQFFMELFGCKHLIGERVAQQTEAQKDGSEKDAERYRWLRDKGFHFADVDLSADCDGNPFVDMKVRFSIPEPLDIPYESEEWESRHIDIAIDAAIAKEKAK